MASPLGFEGGLTLAMDSTDRKKSMAWYRDVLGLNVLYEVEDIGWCELASETPGVNVGIAQTESVKKGAVPTFGVKDIGKARRYLEDKDVKFDGETREIPGLVKLATFFDPDGNPLMLFESLQEG
jgi:predicted enzyme related to lactoylglutathione lyase